MELINGILLELNRIASYKTIDGIEKDKHKLTIFIAEIYSITESKSKDNSGTWKACTKIVMNNDDVYKVVEKYNKLFPLWVDWWKEQQEKSKDLSNPV